MFHDSCLCCWFPLHRICHHLHLVSHVVIWSKTQSVYFCNSQTPSAVCGSAIKHVVFVLSTVQQYRWSSHELLHGWNVCFGGFCPETARGRSAKREGAMRGAGPRTEGDEEGEKKRERRCRLKTLQERMWSVRRDLNDKDHHNDNQGGRTTEKCVISGQWSGP